MEIKTGSKTITGTNATVLMDSGDHLSVGYKNPNTGKTDVFCISARHLVFVVTHEETEKSLLVRPSVGVEFVGN